MVSDVRYRAKGKFETRIAYSQVVVIAKLNMSRDNPVVILKGQSRKNLLTQLVQFLLRVPPPSPLEWDSFRLHVVTRYAGYFPENVLNEMYASLQKAYNERKDAIQTITIDSDSDQGEPEPQVCEKSKSPKEERIDSSHQTQEIPQPQAAPVLTDEEWARFREERVVKKHEYYLKEIYSLVKEIQDTTSCSVCAKLKARITKFRNYVSKDSEVIQMKVAAKFKSGREVEEEAKCKSTPSRSDSSGNVPAGESSNKSKKRRSSNPKVDLSYVTDEEVEKMRMDLLLDKLIEISMPDIMKAAEAIEKISASNVDTDLPKSKRPKRKSRRKDKLDSRASVRSESTEHRVEKGERHNFSLTSRRPNSSRPENDENGMSVEEENTCSAHLLTPSKPYAKRKKTKKKGTSSPHPSTSREQSAELSNSTVSTPSSFNVGS